MTLKFKAFFMIFLILTLNVYSVSAQSITVEKNSGKDGLEGFVRGSDDVWNLEVSVSGVSNIKADDVTVNGVNFDQCSTSGAGIFCSYKYDYLGTSIFSGSYPLKLLVRAGSTLIAQASSNVVVDGRNPKVSQVKASQEGTQVRVNYTVQEFGDSCVGLEKVEFFSGNNLLKSISMTGLSNPCVKKTFSELVPAKKGLTEVRVVATDRFNHSSGYVSNPLTLDLVGPVVLDQTFSLGSFNEFLPDGRKTFDISIDVEEDGNLNLVGSSSELGIKDELAVCQSVVPGNYTCTWKARSVDLSQDVYSLKLKASDNFNVVERTVTKSFKKDSTYPKPLYLGTPLIQNRSEIAVKSSDNKIIVVLREDGAGINPSDIKVDFGDVGLGVLPMQKCQLSGNAYFCSRNDTLGFTSGGNINVVVGAQDRVGNLVRNKDLISSRLVLDNTPPTLVPGSLSIKTSGYDLGFVQSHDILEIFFQAKDLHGVVASADLSDLVNVGSGLFNFSCSPDKGDVWNCSLITPNVVSGPKIAQLKIDMFDFALNKGEVDREDTKVEILFADADTKPDYWRVVGNPKSSPLGVDIGVMPFVAQKIFFEVELKTSNKNVSSLGFAPNPSCKAPEGVKAFLTNNFVGSLKPNLGLVVLPVKSEALPEPGNVTIECDLQIFSRVGDNVLSNLEVEPVNLTLEYFMALTSADPAGDLDSKIKKAREKAETGFFGVIGTLQKILDYIKVFCSFINVAHQINRIVNVIIVAADGTRAGVGPGQASATAICVSQRGGYQIPVWGVIEGMQVFCALASCSQNPSLGWYANYQKSVIDIYNVFTGRFLFGEAVTESTSLYDNLYLSAAGLCLPGIIYNLDKLRQVQCRYITCLEDEVKSGFATVASCRELKDYQECKYVYGQLAQLIPIVGAWDSMLNFVKGFITDPIGVGRLALKIVSVSACTGECVESGAASVGCDVLTWFLEAVDFANMIIGAFETTKTINQDYCSQIL